MARFLYNLVFPVVLLFLLPTYLRRMVRRGGWRAGFPQRLGILPAELRARLAAEGARRLWIQAVSVGEMLVALKLLAALRRRAPGLRVLLSTTTTTGHALALPHAGPGTEVLYTPLDLLPCIRRAWRDLRPAALVVVEGGLWPNALALARAERRPVALVNARLSPRSERRFRRGRMLAAPALFTPLDLVTAPEPGDVARWVALGVPAGALRVVGNVKFDFEPDDDAPVADGTLLSELAAHGWPTGDPSRPVLLAGSTHPGEESLVAGVLASLREKFPALRLAVAPRHVERSADVARELADLGLRVARRTALGAAPAGADVLLLDTTGELREFYALGTVVVIGKSLGAGATGGQNPVEALAAGRPVVWGAHMENFSEITTALLAAGAAVRVADAGELERELARLLGDVNARAALVANAAGVLATHRGAADRTAELVLKMSE